VSDEVKRCEWCRGTQKRLVTHVGTREQHGMPCACLVTDLPVRFFYQPEDYGCGIAAIAIATQHDYATVRRLLVMSEDLSGHTLGAGLNVAQADDILDQLGFAWRARYSNLHRLGTVRNPWPCEPFADTHVAHVRSLSQASNHFVCWLRDGRVLDPWWGVVQGLHRYSQVYSIKGLYRIAEASP
jgi:hypothetical protein